MPVFAGQVYERTFRVGRFPVAITIDGSGNVWVAGKSGTIPTTYGVAELSSYGAVMGIYRVGRFPKAVTIDGNGNVWVAN
jgi:streptogramin lyase